MPTDELLTAAQAADRAQVNRRTITRWAESGRLPAAMTLPGDTGARLFRPADIDAAVAAESEPVGASSDGGAE